MEFLVTRTNDRNFATARAPHYTLLEDLQAKNSDLPWPSSSYPQKVRLTEAALKCFPTKKALCCLVALGCRQGARLFLAHLSFPRRSHGAQVGFVRGCVIMWSSWSPEQITGNHLHDQELAWHIGTPQDPKLELNIANCRGKP